MCSLIHKPPYKKWVGLLLGILIPGSAHFLSGHRVAGIQWLFGLIILDIICLTLLVIPWTVTYVVGAILVAIGFVARLVVWKQSYRSVNRIGFKGWLLLIGFTVVWTQSRYFMLHAFVQPFRVPTAAMQPTIMGRNGVAVEEDEAIHSLFDRIWYGREYLEVYAQASGVLNGPVSARSFPGFSLYLIEGKKHLIPGKSEPLIEPGSMVRKGDLLWRGFDVAGDFVYVEKVSYWFREPRRGEIVVFKTGGVKGIQQDTFYVKRLAGLPGETIIIKPPFLYVNGHKTVKPEIFRLISSKREGYSGYSPTGLPGSLAVNYFLNEESDEVALGKNECFVLGDNSLNSYDSRYWGPIPRDNIIGKVTRVYWPFSRINALGGMQ